MFRWFFLLVAAWNTLVFVINAYLVFPNLSQETTIAMLNMGLLEVKYQLYPIFIPLAFYALCFKPVRLAFGLRAS